MWTETVFSPWEGRRQVGSLYPQCAPTTERKSGKGDRDIVETWDSCVKVILVSVFIGLRSRSRGFLTVSVST